MTWPTVVRDTYSITFNTSNAPSGISWSSTNRFAFGGDTLRKPAGNHAVICYDGNTQDKIWQNNLSTISNYYVTPTLSVIEDGETVSSNKTITATFASLVAPSMTYQG